MKRNKLLLSFFLLSTILISIFNPTNTNATNADRPKLVVGIVVDQMRWDYLYRYYSLYGEGGFKRLMNEGYNCENTMINYVPSVTAIGHSSIYTGSVPAIHGITGNNFYINGQKLYCCDDTTVSTVGSKSKAGLMSPRNLLATTIGDELKIATDFKSKVIGVSIKDRASILPAGHSADAAYWIDNSTGTFITSTYYMKQLPEWVVKFNKSFGKHTSDEINYSIIGNQITEEMAKAAIDNEQLGLRGYTDLLTISFSSTDKIGHKYATHHPKTQEIYVDLDQRLSDFFKYLDLKIGKNNYLVFLTADHGAANNILFSQDHGIPAQAFFYDKVRQELNSYLQQYFGSNNQMVISIDSYKVYLNHKSIANSSLNLDDVKKVAIEWLKKDPIYSYVVDFEKINESSIPQIIKDKIINGYHRLRSGDIQLVLNPACYEVYGEKIDEGTTHGTWNPYDAHIPFILMGWNIKSGYTNARTYITDIAPTICSLIHIQMPNGSIGSPIF